MSYIRVGLSLIKGDVVEVSPGATEIMVRYIPSGTTTMCVVCETFANRLQLLCALKSAYE